MNVVILRWSWHRIRSADPFERKSPDVDSCPINPSSRNDVVVVTGIASIESHEGPVAHAAQLDGPICELTVDERAAIRHRHDHDVAGTGAARSAIVARAA